jgi:hypothetical protein
MVSCDDRGTGNEGVPQWETGRPVIAHGAGHQESGQVGPPARAAGAASRSA